MLTLAERLNQVNIVIIDPNQNLINRWNNNEIPFFEPQVENLLQQHLGQKVVFSNDNRNSIRHANVIFLAADIKSDQRPAFMDGNLDLTSWRDMAMLVRRHAAGTSKIVIDKSSVPIGEDNLIDLLHPNPNTHLTVFYIPEFFSAGTIMHDLLNPDRILIGFRSENPNLQRIFQIYSWLPVQQIKMYNLQQYRAVEVIKIFTNVFLGANAILGNIGAAICEKEEADIGIVMDEISSDRRLRGLPNPHGAIGGHDLNRDIQFAVYKTWYERRS